MGKPEEINPFPSFQCSKNEDTSLASIPDIIEGILARHEISESYRDMRADKKLALIEKRKAEIKQKDKERIEKETRNKEEIRLQKEHQKYLFRARQQLLIAQRSRDVLSIIKVFCQYPVLLEEGSITHLEMSLSQARIARHIPGKKKYNPIIDEYIKILEEIIEKKKATSLV